MIFTDVRPLRIRFDDPEKRYYGFVHRKAWWVSNGHWLLRAECFKFPEEALKTFGEGRGWIADRDGFAPKKGPDGGSVGSILRSVAKAAPLTATSLLVHPTSSPSGFDIRPARILVDKSRRIVAGVAEHYFRMVDKMLDTYEVAGVSDTAPIRIRKDRVVVGCVMPMRIDYDDLFKIKPAATTRRRAA